MTTGAPYGPTPSDEKDAASPASPSLRAAWLLRATAVVGVLAAIAAQIIARGLEGMASDRVVARADTAAATLAYFFGALCWMLALWGSIEVLRARRAPVMARVVVVAGSAVVVTLSLLAVGRALPPPGSLVLSMAGTAALLAGAWSALRESHTRAVGVVMAALAGAAIMRLAGWEIAMGSASDGGGFSPHTVTWSRGCATAGVVLESIAQLAAAAWLGTRGKLYGQLLSSVAVAAAFFVTWGVARGATTGIFWEVLLNRALGDAAGSIPPYYLTTVAVFLASAALLLALVAAVQPRQIAAVVAALSLALLSRGALDAPLRALAACAAAHWITIAMADDRAMWRMLLEARAAQGATATAKDER